MNKCVGVISYKKQNKRKTVVAHMTKIKNNLIFLKFN